MVDRVTSARGILSSNIKRELQDKETYSPEKSKNSRTFVIGKK
jgi:hypothetical protein